MLYQAYVGLKYRPLYTPKRDNETTLCCYTTSHVAPPWVQSFRLLLTCRVAYTL